MSYIAAIDYEHLDDGLFLTGLAQSISKQKKTQQIILHADSAYTERIMQTGVMREDAKIRSQKDLNHRLIALFADEGIAAIGINGYQRKLIRLEDNELVLDKKQFKQLPRPSAIVLSCLVWDEQKAAAVPVTLPRLAGFLEKSLEIDELFIFNKSDSGLKDNSNKSRHRLSDEFKEEHLPEEFQNNEHSFYLTTARDFQYVPDLKSCIYIE